MSSVETGQMSAVETGQMTAAETSVLSQQKTVKKHRVFECLSSRPPILFERGEGQSHQVSIFTMKKTPVQKMGVALSARSGRCRDHPVARKLLCAVAPLAGCSLERLLP